MSRVCVICGKGGSDRASGGNNVSHSNRKTRRTFGVNVHKVKVELDGVESSQYVCTRCLRSQKNS
ncbi:MAG: 50S ribosomal protein L28 [Clostridia bacterium]|jgi:large subunit ribosomal protein L28|nr:50S ribosomal protein L28 [Clostridia bacterium]